MIEIGKINTLKVTKQNASGIYLSDESSKNVLLSDKTPKNYPLGEMLTVFVFVDSQGHLAATTQLPKAEIGQFVYLKVKSLNYYGAFLEWHFQKDLLLPFSEQHYELQVGKFCLVKLFLDDKQRVTATANIDKFLTDYAEKELVAGQEVDLLITESTELGVKAIVNNRYWGLLYHNELYQKTFRGNRIKGYIKNIRSDLRIDLSLQPLGYQKILPLTETILFRLKSDNGFLSLSDKSSPEEIYAAFSVSKKAFKQAIGALYKQNKIVIHEKSISLV